MKSIVKIALAITFTASSFCGTANAAIISGAHTTGNGDTVNLSGLEWLSWNETAGVSRVDIEADLGGFITDGWRYATVAEFTSLYTSAYDDFSGNYVTANADGGRWLFSHLYNPTGVAFTVDINGTLGRNFLLQGLHYGNNNNGHFRVQDSDGSLGNGDSIDSSWMDYWHIYGNSPADPTRGKDYASVLVRAAPLVSVPEPSILALMSLGFLGMFGLNRRRVQA